MLGVFSFHFCQSPIVFHGFGFCKYVYIGVSFFVSPLSLFKENHESNTEMKRPLLKWLMIILRLPHIYIYDDIYIYFYTVIIKIIYIYTL